MNKIFFTLLTLFPSLAKAADTDGPFKPDNFNNGFGINNRDVTVVEIALKVFTTMLSVIGYGTIILLVYYGIMMASSKGDTAKVEQAKKSLIWSIVGIIIIGISLYLIQATKNATNGIGI